MSNHDDLGWWEKVWEEYSDFIVLYFVLIFAVFGAFCIGVLVMA